MKISKYLGTGLLFGGGIIFFLGLKVANYHMYFLIIGGVMALAGFYFLQTINKKEENQMEFQFNQWRNKLKSSGIVLDADFDKCEIKSNKYREEVVKDGYSPTDKYMAMDVFVGRDNKEYNNVDQSVIVFETELSGEKRKFISPVINKEKTTLQFLLMDKKSTKIYIDRMNKDNYYFDLEFI